jgi:hypothetical protein
MGGRPLPDRARGRPCQDGLHEITSPVATIPDPADVAALLERLGELEQNERRRQAAWREGWRIGWRAGYEAGREAEGAERDRAWRINAGMILVRLDPDGPEARESEQRRLRAAEAGCRRDAWDHWRDYWQRMYALARDPRYIAAARALPAYEGPTSGGRSHEQVIVLLIADGLLHPAAGAA